MAFSKEKAHERAERFAAKGQHDKAAREYQAIVQSDPKDIRAWLMLADCLVRSGDRPGAITNYLQVADFYASQKELQKALAVYRQVLNLDPSRIDVHVKCANIHMKLGRTHEAVQGFEAVAQAQLQLGRVGDALKTYRLVADAEPTAVSKRLRLAELYSREKQVDQAVEAFRNAGDQLLAAGRKADFVRVAERLIYHRNDDRETIRKLARVYLEMGDPRRALMKLNALLQTDQSDQEGLELLAETFMTLRKPDKAVSVLVELVRSLRQRPDGGQMEALRVLQRGLRWDPNHAELHRLRAELEVTAVAQDPSPQPLTPVEPDLELPDLADEHDSEVLELDEEDVEEEDGMLAEAETEIQTRAQHFERMAQSGRDGRSGAPMTRSVLDEVTERASAAGDEALTDLDKILFEARVYVKYRLFEHALEHIKGILAQDADHVGALGLRARALTELGRPMEAAETHTRVAELVLDRDPKLAREHVEAALEQVPGHAPAMTMRTRLSDAGVTAPPSTRHADVQSDGIPLDLDYGGDDHGQSDAVDLLDEDDDLGISITEAEERPESSRQFPVENRFGLSEAGPLPGGRQTGDFGGLDPLGGEDDFGDLSLDDDEDRYEDDRWGDEIPTLEQPPDEEHDEHDMTLVGAPLRTDSSETEPVALPEESATQQVDVLELDLEDRGKIAATAGDEDSFAFDLTDDDDDSELDTVSLANAFGSSNGASQTPLLGHSDGQPEPEEVDDREWPDISDDIAEVRFFLDQGLDDDAAYAVAELRKRYPGHPEVERLAAGAAAETTAPSIAEPVGAQPLLTFDEDEEADAYLAAIFDKDAVVAGTRRERESRAIAEIEGADARTHFDLGMAYREMGLVDEAIAQFEAAARDHHWQSRSLVMLGTLRLHRGETEQAVADLRKAIAAANNEDERCEANYELGLLFEKIGDTPAAIEQLQAVTAGFRDRDERLDQLLG